MQAITLQGVPWVVTMKMNAHYFPTKQFVKDSAMGWTMHEDDKVFEGKGPDGVVAPEGERMQPAQ